MNIFQFLQIFVLSYTGIAAIFGIVIIAFQIRYGFNNPESKYHLFQILNKLQGKTTILLPFRILSVLFMVAWLALALPLIDVFTGLHLITSFVEDVEGWTAVQTWFGVLTDQDNAGGKYFFVVFVSILGIKGFWVLKRMADILSTDELAVSNYNRWGSSRDFKK